MNMRRFSHKIKSKPNKGGIWEYNGVIKKFQGWKQSGESKNPLRANEGIFGYFFIESSVECSRALGIFILGTDER